METVFRENKMLGDNTAEGCLDAGKRLGAVFRRVALGRDSESLSQSMPLISGLICSGADVLDLGECVMPELFTASRLADCPVCIYCREDALMKLEIRAEGGIYLNSRERKLLEGSLKDSTDKPQSQGKISDGKIFKELYNRPLMKLFTKNKNYSISLTRSGQHEKKLVSHSDKAHELIISLSSDGTKASAYSLKSGFISMEELTLINCLDSFDRGRDAALPFSFPHAANTFAEKFGRRILRYYASPADENDNEARKLAIEQRFTLDGAYLAANALSYLAEKNSTFEEIRKVIPRFYTSKRFVELESERTKAVFQRFSSRVTPDGASFAKNSSRIIMQPSAAGRGVWLTADSFSMEAANELCSVMEERLKNNTFQ